MKKKIFLMLSLALMLSCLFVISVSAEITVYDDAPAKTNIQVSTDDVAVFDDGFSCPSAYICKDNEYVGNNEDKKLKLMLDFSWINEKTGKTYTVANLLEFDIPQGIEIITQYFFSKNTTLKKCSIPDSVVTMEQCVFQQATALEELVMEHDENDALTEFVNWTVYGCTSLKAFSMPDCITQMTGVAQFNSCTSLTALYLSKNLTSINSGAGGTASFGFCPNMFFVNEPFTYDNVPTEKPRVYYFPENLTSLPSGGEVFKNSTSLNDVLVFPKGVTEIANGWAFCNTNAVSIVFLGNMVNVSTTGNAWNKDITIYFCNEADKSSADLTGLGGNPKKVYCHADGNTTHIAERNVDTEATCVSNIVRTSYCFCGEELGTSEVENTALGHSHTIYLGLIYESFDKEGAYSYKCERCDDVNKDEVAPALFVCLGYSASENGNAGLILAYKVNHEAIENYKTETNSALEYGMFAVLKSNIGENGILNADGSENAGVIKADLT
ncbi:MAG: leucine-rich repeat protein, partial [Clostridia bacterium]|nr:leucine-rich repeat protein [Clostridia bacterium]